jgi:hypothetical protein
MAMHTFDMQALHAALDEKRCALGLSWEELATDINKPFKGTTSIPISTGTIRTMVKKSSVTSAVVLQVLRWLDRTPESFLSGRLGQSNVDEKLPAAGAAHILRFDTQAMHAALNDERQRRGLTWKQLAVELPGFTQSMIANLAEGPLIGFPRVMMIPQWLKCPAATFVRVRNR